MFATILQGFRGVYGQSLYNSCTIAAAVFLLGQSSWMRGSVLLNKPDEACEETSLLFIGTREAY